MKHLAPVLLMLIAAASVTASAGLYDPRLGLLCGGLICGLVGFLFVDFK